MHDESKLVVDIGEIVKFKGFDCQIICYGGGQIVLKVPPNIVIMNGGAERMMEKVLRAHRMEVADDTRRDP
jgi:hypothetical protein